ncbi:MAG: alpha/beta hydrolase-fold protein [Actinobacteria bacterium]|nr:alpha/beta hydrolase-fold protein [Actinomycetota bacterium]
MMQEIKRFQVRGVLGEVVRLKFGARTVDYWKPPKGSDTLLIAHDGQNIFDGKSSTHRGQTWEMAQSAIRVSRELGISTPSIIGVWHSSTKENPWGRGKDLVPEKYFREGLEVHADFVKILEDKSVLQSDSYFREIFETIVPALEPEIDPKRTAMIGSSMGGLATLYAAAQMPQRFSTALALSTHWPFGGNPLVEKTINSLPIAGTHRVWMSHGTKGLDSEYAPFQVYADKLMHERGYRTNDFTSRVYPRSGHNERSWAKYLDQPLSFWLDSKTQTP